MKTFFVILAVNLLYPFTSNADSATGDTQSLPQSPSGALRFTSLSATIQIPKPAEAMEHIFAFENSSQQPVAISYSASACPPCATVRVEPEILEAGKKGRVVVTILPSRRKGKTPIAVLVRTVESDSDHQYEITLTADRPQGSSNAARAAARLANRPPSGLARESAAGQWHLRSLNIWMDAAGGESMAIDEKEREKIRTKDFPIGETRLKLDLNGSFNLAAGRHQVAGAWSLNGNILPLEIKRPDCPACNKTWPLEVVTATRDQMVIDLPDDDEGSPRMIRLEFARTITSPSTEKF